MAAKEENKREKHYLDTHSLNPLKTPLHDTCDCPSAVCNCIYGAQSLSVIRW